MFIMEAILEKALQEVERDLPGNSLVDSTPLSPVLLPQNHRLQQIQQKPIHSLSVHFMCKIP